MRAVSWELCGQCKLCPGKVDPETRKCFRHQERGCFHDDCTHYVPVNCLPFCCKDAKGPDLRIPQTWIQVNIRVQCDPPCKELAQLQYIYMSLSLMPIVCLTST